LAVAAHADETALLCLCLTLAPRLFALSTVERYKDLDVDLQAIIWEVLSPDRPLLHPHIAADEIEGRITGRIQPEVRKVVRRKKLAPTDALPSGDDDTAPEIAAPARGDINLRLDMEATLERLPPAQRQVVIGAAIYGLTEGEMAEEMGVQRRQAEKARATAFAKARAALEASRKK
jgi:hypothetical protein